MCRTRPTDNYYGTKNVSGCGPAVRGDTFGEKHTGLTKPRTHIFNLPPLVRLNRNGVIVFPDGLAEHAITLFVAMITHATYTYEYNAVRPSTTINYAVTGPLKRRALITRAH